MTVVVVVLAVTVCVATLGALRARARGALLARRLDAIATQMTGDVVIASPSPELAADRLERLTNRPNRDRHRPPPGSTDTDRYRIALDTITLGVVLVDDDARVRYRNPFAATFLDGRHGAAVVGHVIDELAAAAISGSGAEREVQLYGPPRRKLFVSASPIVTTGGERQGVVVMIDDITEQERLDAIRRDFVANISHELRTPIGAMSLLAETLVGETDPDVVESLSTRLSLEANRLGRTIEDLLQLSRIEHGSDDDFAPVTIQHVVATVHDRVRFAAEQRGVDIGVVLPARDLVVRGDERQLASALFNLLDNAVKYSAGNGGTVSVRARGVDEQVEIVVQDNGIGIPRKDLDRIFERFYRVDQSRQRDSGGTGLGLSIVRHVVANHGGRIDVESSEGEGATFTMQLPVARSPERLMPADASASPPPPPDDGADHEVTRP